MTCVFVALHGIRVKILRLVARVFVALHGIGAIGFKIDGPYIYGCIKGLGIMS